MGATTEKINSVQHRITISVPSDSVNNAFTKAFQKIQRRVRLQGFRPGKAPLSIIRKLYADSVASEVAETLVQENLVTALTDNSINPIASPVVEMEKPPAPDNEYSFSAVVDVMPELSFEDYKGISVNAERFEITNEAVNRDLESLRRRQAQTEAAADDAIADDLHLLTLKQSAQFEGTGIDAMNIEEFDVALGQKQLFDELEAGIRGMKTGETKTIPVTLPANYGDEELAGKTVDVTIEVKKLQKLILPELNDEFAKDFDASSLDELKDKIRTHLEEQGENLRKQKIESSILNHIIDSNPFEVPPSLVDQVIDGMIENMRWSSREELDENLRSEELRKECRPEARRRAKNTLVLWHVAQKETIEATDQEINERIDTLLAPMMQQAGKKPDAALKQRIQPRVKENIVLEKTLNFLIENATISDIPTKI